MSGVNNTESDFKLNLSSLNDEMVEAINDAEIGDRPLDREVEIESLAALEPIDYEVARNTAADRLGLRASILGREVKKKRRELGLDNADEDAGQSRAIKIEDVLPWPKPVDGDRIATALSATLKRYVVLQDTAADAIALWILHTRLVDKLNFNPRLPHGVPRHSFRYRKTQGLTIL
jgi:hypothetical protein